MTARNPAIPLTSSASAGEVASWGRRALTRLLALAILCLVFMGAQVKSHGAGLAVPDWPLAYGQLWPRMVGGVFFEHWHRAIATGVGLLTIVVAVWTARSEARAWVRRLGWGLLGAVVLQGLLGGLTVKQLLPPAVSATHAGLAQTVLCLAAWLAYAGSLEWARLASNPGAPTALPPGLAAATERLAAGSGTGDERAVVGRERAAAASGRSALRAATLAMAAVYVQLALGAWMRHTEAGLAVPFFPVDGQGHLWPAVVDQRVLAHMLHRGFALVVMLLVWRAARRAVHASPGVTGHAAALSAAVLLQGLLGALVIWTGKAPALTSIHVTNGALVLVLSWLLVLRLWRRVASATPLAPEGSP